MASSKSTHIDEETYFRKFQGLIMSLALETMNCFKIFKFHQGVKRPQHNCNFMKKN